MNDAKTCRCPMRPYLGGMARDSQMQTAADERWNAEHGAHSYAEARDRLAKAIQAAEGELGRGSGPLVLDMVADVFGLPRKGAALWLGLPDKREELAPAPESA